MTYEQALAYWFGHVNYEQRAPAAADLKLDRMRALLARLGSPHQRLRVVHVAGSKGKGSTAAMLAAILTRAGYRTGLFTSPHLVTHEERFQIDGRPALPAELAQLLTEVREAVEQAPRPLAGGPPTFFEIATAVGFLHFVRRRADAAVLEVGLGGRLDSTNVCRPAVSVITSISHDHTALLGDRLASIAREKAGIIKPHRPVVSGATVPEACEVIEAVARGHRAPLTRLGADFHFRYHPGRVSQAELRLPRVEVVTARRRWPAMEVNLLGEHQGANAAVAVATVEELRARGWTIPDGAVRAGLGEVDWPARLEVVARRPLTVLDCAHNVASAVALVDTLLASFPPGRRWLVFAASGDKDIPGMFRALAPHFAGAFLTRYTSPRAIAPEQLAASWADAGGTGAQVVPVPAEALRAAQGAAGPEELICVTGSVFLAGELRPLLVGRSPSLVDSGD
jgi:dihydrofolate synthase/folylpolyglutamate synthase